MREEEDSSVRLSQASKNSHEDNGLERCVGGSGGVFQDRGEVRGSWQLAAAAKLRNRDGNISFLLSTYCRSIHTTELPIMPQDVISIISLPMSPPSVPTRQKETPSCVSLSVTPFDKRTPEKRHIHRAVPPNKPFRPRQPTCVLESRCSRQWGSLARQINTNHPRTLTSRRLHAKTRAHRVPPSS